MFSSQWTVVISLGQVREHVRIFFYVLICFGGVYVNIFFWQPGFEWDFGKNNRWKIEKGFESNIFFWKFFFCLRPSSIWVRSSVFVYARRLRTKLNINIHPLLSRCISQRHFVLLIMNVFQNCDVWSHWLAGGRRKVDVKRCLALTAGKWLALPYAGLLLLLVTFQRYTLPKGPIQTGGSGKGVEGGLT